MRATWDWRRAHRPSPREKHYKGDTWNVINHISILVSRIGQRMKPTTHRRAVFTSAIFNAPRTLGIPANQRTACQQARHLPPTRLRGSRGALRRPSARNTRALKGLACPSWSVQRRATCGGALDACRNASRTTVRRKWRPAGTCTSMSIFVRRRGRRQVSRRGVERKGWVRVSFSTNRSELRTTKETAVLLSR